MSSAGRKRSRSECGRLTDGGGYGILRVEVNEKEAIIMTNTTVVRSTAAPRLSVKAQTLAALAAIAAAVAVPQIFHLLGAISGLGTALGETFLPMHLPILLVGLLAGPWAGAAAGLLGPLCSFALSGMPGAVMLPFMMAELGAYGLFAGLMRRTSLPVFVQVLTAQIAGRAVRAGAILLGVYAFGSPVAVNTIWMSSVIGVFGIVLQWALLPLLVYRVENRTK